MHIIGEIVGASDFDESNLFCKWELMTGNDKWSALEGTLAGQTQLSLAQHFNEDLVVWNHPMDVYLSTTSLEGWPRFRIEVWHEDSFGRNELSGYGFVHVPTGQGRHKVECVLWKPRGSFSERVFNFFFGTSSHLEHKDLVYADSERFDLFTESVGSVHFELEVLMRGFRNKGVEFAPAAHDEDA